MKKCSKCKQEKEEVEFSFSSKKKDNLQSECKLCQSKMVHKHYEKNKANYKNKAKENKKKIQTWLNELKKDISCQKCGIKHIAVIDFHHLDSKTKDKGISYLVSINNKKRLEEEIKKCIPLCSNCHRILHWEEKTSHNAASG